MASVQYKVQHVANTLICSLFGARSTATFSGLRSSHAATVEDITKLECIEGIAPRQNGIEATRPSTLAVD